MSAERTSNKMEKYRHKEKKMKTPSSIYNFAGIARIENNNRSFFCCLAKKRINWIRLHKRIYHMKHSRCRTFAGRWYEVYLRAHCTRTTVHGLLRKRHVQFNPEWDNWILWKLLMVTVSCNDIVHFVCKLFSPSHLACGHAYHAITHATESLSGSVNFASRTFICISHGLRFARLEEFWSYVNPVLNLPFIFCLCVVWISRVSEPNAITISVMCALGWLSPVWEMGKKEYFNRNGLHFMVHRGRWFDDTNEHGCHGGGHWSVAPKWDSETENKPNGSNSNVNTYISIAPAMITFWEVSSRSISCGRTRMYDANGCNQKVNETNRTGPPSGRSAESRTSHHSLATHTHMRYLCKPFAAISDARKKCTCWRHTPSIIFECYNSLMANGAWNGKLN